MISGKRKNKFLRAIRMCLLTKFSNSASQNSFNKDKFFCIFFFIFLIPLTVYSQNFPQGPKPWQDAYNISLSSFQFSHPMTVINQEELEIIKQRIRSNVEPQKTTYAQLLAEAAKQLNFVPDAPYTMNIMGGYEPNSNLEEMREWLWRNCHAAYTCALAYALTDDSVYAEKTREVLMDWANMMTTFTGGDRGLQLGSWFSPMLYAADLIDHYAGWTSSDRINFKYWWRNNCLVHTIDVMRSKDNNWKDAGLLGVFSAAVVLEDTLLLKEGLIQLKSYFFSRTDNYVQNPGPGWKIKKDSHGVYLPREVVRNDGSSGLTYTAYALTTMTQCFEIARYAGFNCWNDATEEGATIQELIEQYFRWDIENAPFPWHSNPNKSTKRRNCYELANVHFDLNSNLKNWIKTNWPLSGREGDEYCSLTKGDLGVSGIVAPLTPGCLTARAVSSKQIDLTWTDLSDNEDGFKIERNTGASFFYLARVAANVTSYSDKFFLTDSTAYTYRVRAYAALANSNYSNEASEMTLGQGDTLIVLNPSDDACVAGGVNGDYNYGCESELVVQNGSEPDALRKSYVKFDFARMGIKNVKRAVVRLHAHVVSPCAITVYETSDNWHETSITWNNAPEQGIPIIDVPVSKAGQYFEWEVTSFVQRQAIEDSIVSLLFHDAAAANVPIKFNAKESHSNIPELEIVAHDFAPLHVITKAEPFTPDHFTLDQNYPNPFNSTTTIQYHQKKAGFTILKIYDILGQEVETLVNEYQKEGHYQVSWEAKNLPSGIYFYRLQSAGFSATKKLILQK